MEADVEGASECTSSTIWPMPVVGLTYQGTLQLTHMCCVGCQQQYEPCAVSLGCFPSSPVVPQRWFDLEVFTAYRDLAFKEGLSASGQ